MAADAAPHDNARPRSRGALSQVLVTPLSPAKLPRGIAYARPVSERERHRRGVALLGGESILLARPLVVGEPGPVTCPPYCPTEPEWIF